MQLHKTEILLPKWGRSRQRGTTLLEAALTAALAGTLIALGHSLLLEATERNRDEADGRAFGLVTMATQRYVSAQWDSLLEGLAGLPPGPAARVVDLSQGVAGKALDPVLLSRPNSHGKIYRLLLRAVGSTGTKTLNVSEIDTDSDGKVDSHLRDGDIRNGELELESILVTTGGRSFSRQSAGQAVDASGLAAVGSVFRSGLAHGPHGTWQMDITPFKDLAGYPSVGHLVSLVSLAGYGVLGQQADPESGTASGSHPLERCENLTGQALTDCAASNEIYSEVVFAQYSDGSKPAKSAGFMQGLRRLEMARPRDTDADGVEDLFAAIANLSELACGKTASGGQAAGRFLVTCDKVDFSGAIVAAGSVTGERFLARAIGDQDLTEGIYDARIVSMSPPPRIAKPDCTAPATPQVFASPVAFVSPGGIPLVGIAALADQGEDEWSIRMIASVAADTDGDGLSDEIALASANDHALVLTRCS